MVRISFASHLLARRRTIVLSMAAALGLLVLLTGVGSTLDQGLRNLRDTVRSRPASGQVHVVEIDSRSLNLIHKWPVPRRVHAAAIDRLNQAGARIIAFDVDFSAVSDPVEDAKLAASLKRAGGSVVLPSFRQSEGSGSSNFVENAPLKMFADHAFLGSVNIAADGDGYVRNMLLGVETLGTPRPSLSTLLAESTAAIGQAFQIDYAVDPQSIPRHSLVDLIEGRVPAAELAGKRILIGATAIEMGDRYTVPRHGVIPGVVIHALAAETLLTGQTPESLSGIVPLLLILVAIALAVRTDGRTRSIAILGVGTVALLTLPLVTEAYMAISMPIAPALAAAAVAALLGGFAMFLEASRENSLTDADTGLPNLRALEAAVSKLSSANIVVAHIDRFAVIAAGLGPEATIKLILRVAERLELVTRQCQVYRTDEASLAWVEAPDEEAGLGDRIDSISALMRAPIEAGRLVDVALSFGVAGGKPHEAKQLVANATLAALNAWQKDSRWEKFSEKDGEATSWHLSLLGELDTAMASGHLWNAYQAKLDLSTGRIVAAEALVRWDHPERGPIQPDSFIPLVEANGRARDLTAYVLNQALEDALAWQEKGFPLGVAVNVSASLLTDHAFIEEVGQIIQGSRLPSNRVTIEVTETAAMNSPERAIAALESWRGLGVIISIDDYGTGQSSLAYLQKLPANELKIDKSFVQTIGDDRRNAIMVRSTIALAHELGMKVVAEGVEDAACLALLAEMGCDTAQGYFISRPVTADAVAELLQERSRAAA
jgi:EAL domain-containing protein (putative c-di-GMP-specific phosphodiesterase class I)/CHASE2 domain-containing sensor protein